MNMRVMAFGLIVVTGPAAVHDAMRHAGVTLLSRHALMSARLRNGDLGPSTMYFAERLHTSDAGYRCLVERVADLMPTASSKNRKQAPATTMQ